MKTNNKGFSLVELIVVIAIMAILAAVAIPTFASFITKANVASDVDFINNVEYAAELANAGIGDETNTAATIKLGADKKPSEIEINGVVIVKTGAKDTDASAEVKAWAKDIADTIDWDYTFKSVAANDVCALNTDGKTINEDAAFTSTGNESEDSSEANSGEASSGGEG